MQPKRLLLLIACIAVVSGIIAMPGVIPIKVSWGPVNIDTTIRRPEFRMTILGRRIYKDLDIKKGLDLQGGVHVVLQADMDEVELADRETALESARNVIDRRVDMFGVGEPVIQTSVTDGNYRIIVELPGVTDVNQALELIGRTAQLDFRELPPEATESADLLDFEPTGLTGRYLRRAQVVFGQTGLPEVSIEFDREGSEMFSEITRRNINKPVAIFLDELPVTMPVVNQHIVGGQAVISGDFTVDEARNLSIQLNAGALPVSIEVIEQKNIGASLGQESVDRSIRAGALGLSMVLLFMVLFYGKLGLIASAALIVFGLITIALYKLIPVTLTLPGLAGFILSMGMAVDSNILIFERMKEELRLGKPWNIAMELGFSRAWNSIKDANVATLIITFILFNPMDWSFLVTSGMVRGFALTLSIGVLLSMFTGIIVTRTLMRVFYVKS